MENKLVWKVKEIYLQDEMTEFLNSLPEERQLEAKIVIWNVIPWIWYREEAKNEQID